jgi:putative DNA primase/helicase
MSDDPLLIPVPVDDPLQLAWYECNDFGNARRLEVLAKGLLKWVDDKFWVAFDGQRWSEREGSYRARAVAHEVAGHIHDEAAALGELIGSVEKPNEAALKRRYGEWCTGDRAMDRLKALHGHAVKSGNAAQTAAMLMQARGLPSMRCWSENFDQDPLAYNVQNGTIRFRPKEGGGWGVQFQAGHDPANMLMQIANVAYDPAAACPQWRERLELVQPDPDQRAVFGRMYGQTLTGLTDSEEFYVHKGRGGDGKSKTHEVMAEIHGDYYRHAAVCRRRFRSPVRSTGPTWSILPATCGSSSARSRRRESRGMASCSSSSPAAARSPPVPRVRRSRSPSSRAASCSWRSIRHRSCPATTRASAGGSVLSCGWST